MMPDDHTDRSRVLVPGLRFPGICAALLQVYGYSGEYLSIPARG